MIAGWTSVKTDDDYVHIVPINDLVEHTIEKDCVCGPKVTEDRMSDATLVVHFALDASGRS